MCERVPTAQGGYSSVRFFYSGRTYWFCPSLIGDISMAVKVKQHKGAWWIFIDHQGKRKAKRIGDSKRAAQQVAEKIQAKIALGQFEIEDKQQHRPFDAYFRNWLDTYVKAHCKERTYETYHDVFRIYHLPFFGQRDIGEISR